MSQSTRVAIVTGASRGLGAVIAKALAGRGYDLVIGGRDAGALEEAAHVLRSDSAGDRARGAGSSNRGRIVAVEGDITEAAVRGRLVQAARDLGGLDVLVNNASELGGIAPLAEVDVSRFARVMRVNAGAPLALIQAALPLLVDRRGLIVNVTSDAAHGAYAGWGPYGASKAALELLTRTLAAELRDRGVSAVIVDPGDMRTRMHQEAFPGEDISDRPLPGVTMAFWNWLFDRQAADVSGERFAAQQEDERWLQRA